MRQLLYDAKDQLRSHPWLSLPSNSEIDIWNYYKFLKIQAFVLSKTLFGIIVISIVDNTLQFQLHRLHNLSFLHLNLQKSCQYDLHHKYLAVRINVQYISFPRDDGIVSCLISFGPFCNIKYCTTSCRP